MHMKYILFFCCLIALTHSKLPKNSFRSFLESFSSDDNIEDPCHWVEDKDMCLKTITPYKSSQCCYFKSFIDDGNGNYEELEHCTLFVNPIKGLDNIKKSEQFKPLLREIGGFMKYNDPNQKFFPPPFSLNLHCEDGDLDVSDLNEKYADDEIETFTSGYHCLNDTISIFKEEPPQQSSYACKDRKLLKPSQDAGIECGNLDFTIKQGFKHITIKTCIPFAYDIFSKLEMPEFLNTLIKEAIQDGHYEKVIVELSDSKGRKIMYDSETGKIVDNSIITSSSSILTISNIYSY